MKKITTFLAGLGLLTLPLQEVQAQSADVMKNYKNSWEYALETENNYDQFNDTANAKLTEKLLDSFSKQCYDSNNRAFLAFNVEYVAKEQKFIEDNVHYFATFSQVPFDQLNVESLAQITPDFFKRENIMNVLELKYDTENFLNGKTFTQDDARKKYKADTTAKDPAINIVYVMPGVDSTGATGFFAIGQTVEKGKETNDYYGHPMRTLFENAYGVAWDSIPKIDSLKNKDLKAQFAWMREQTTTDEEQKTKEAPDKGWYISANASTTPSIGGTFGYDFGRFRLGTGVNYNFNDNASSFSSTSTSQNVTPNIVYTETTENTQTYSRGLSLTPEVTYDFNNHWSVTGQVGVGPVYTLDATRVIEENVVNNVLLERKIGAENQTTTTTWAPHYYELFLNYKFNNGLEIGAGTRFNENLGPNNTSAGAVFRLTKNF